MGKFVFAESANPVESKRSSRERFGAALKAATITGLAAAGGDESSKKMEIQAFIKNGKAINVVAKIPYDFYFNGKVMDNGVSGDRTAFTDKSAVSPNSTSATSAGNVTANSASPETPKRVRVSQNLSQGFLVHKIAPIYPAGARANHLQGTVILDAIIW